MKRSTLLALLVLLVGLVSFRLANLPVNAQAPAAAAQATPDPIATALRTGFDGISRNLSESATKMPEENFAFKPTPDVRSFGEILGHVANSHYSYCSRVKGEPNPNKQNFEQVKAKADMVKALNDSIDYCKAVYASMTDAKIGQPATPTVAAPAAPTGLRVDGDPAAQAPKPAAPPRPMVPFNTLMGNLTHDWEHYGNLVTYLRLKGLVPPSTERAQAGRGRGGM
jgi:uncharacterized damage-inducible protein DinB